MNPMQNKSPIKNESGSVIILAMIFLVLLTIIGLSAISTSTIEVQIAGNEVRYKKNLYRAEGAAMECAQRIENSTDPQFLHPDGTIAINVEGSWLQPDGVDLSDPTILSGISKESSRLTNASYGAVARGIGFGDSLDITAPSTLYEYAVYGLYSGNDGQSHVVIGYKKRF